jgi:hypothetical protein
LLLNAIVRNHGHLTAGDALVVRSWMTFDYIDQLFGMPPGYFKQTMSITDAHYPKLTLSSYAKEENVASATVVSEVENAISAYFAASAPASTSSKSI